MMNILGKYNLILGSSSPRRKEILEISGIPFTQKVIDIEESYPLELPPGSVPGYIAKKKAIPFLSILDTKDILLTSDCLVICDNHILGKPKDREDAIKMLRLLSGRSHQVLTGVCLTNKLKQFVFTVSSTVNFNTLSDEEINYYIDNYQPFDKAGAYAIQEWIGYCKISSIEGSYLNIVGLPMEAVYEQLRLFVNELE